LVTFIADSLTPGTSPSRGSVETQIAAGLVIASSALLFRKQAEQFVLNVKSKTSTNLAIVDRISQVWFAPHGDE
jgi:hypothetical protein